MSEHNKVIQESSSKPPILFIRLMNKRKTWVFLFVFVYTILLLSSWNIFNALLSWYDSVSSNSVVWPAVWVSVGLGLMFGVLSMAAAVAVAVPATLVTWISIVVLMAFCGKPRKGLVVEGRKLTGEISGILFKVLIKEGNVVALLCAVFGYFVLIKKSRDEA